MSVCFEEYEAFKIFKYLGLVSISLVGSEVLGETIYEERRLSATLICNAAQICNALFVCVVVLRHIKSNEVVSSAVSLLYHTFNGQI